MKKPVCGFVVVTSIFAARAASASSFDVQGELVFDPAALYTNGFERGPAPAGGAIVVDPSAIEGASLLRVPASGAPTLTITLPTRNLSAGVSLYMRGGAASVQLMASFAGPGVPYAYAALFPTGQVTSDGWLELKSAPLSLPMGRATSVTLQISNNSTQDSDIDGIEILSEGRYREARACSPPDASACARGEVCAIGYCIDDAATLPPLPTGDDRANLPAWVATAMYGNFGGVASRRAGLPGAFAALATMPAATDATDYWTTLAAAFQLLHDSHTVSVVGFEATDAVPICFVQGDADLSHRQAPSDPQYPDVLVSHGMAGQMAGLVPGDRLVAVNGMHPVAFTRSLLGISSGNVQSTDPTEVEWNIARLNGNIRQSATTITVIHCDAATKRCGAPYTIPVASLPSVPYGQAPICDSRPAYHLASGNPDPASHDLQNQVFYGPLAGTSRDEALFGMIFDSLAPNPGPDPYAGPLADIQQEASGVLIDRRTGYGGSFSYASEISQPFFDTATLTATWGPMPYFSDPLWTQADGLAEYDAVVADNPFIIGSASPKPGLKAAVLVSADVSADDFFAYAMRGAVNVRSFGTKSAGAFASILPLPYAGGSMWVSIGVSDSFTPTGQSLDGTGAEPDEHVVPTQSDLLAGRDTAYERALAWLREPPGGE